MRGQLFGHIVDIQRKVETLSVDNEPIGFEWVNVYTDLPAQLVPVSGGELLRADAEQKDITTRCCIAEVEGVDETMRLMHTCEECDGKVHDIKAVLPDPTYARHLNLMLSAGLRHDTALAEDFVGGGDAGEDEDGFIGGGGA